MSEIRHALLAVLCSGPPQRVDQAWPFGLGSQLTTLLDNAKDLVVNGRSLNLTGVRIVAGDAIPSAGNAAHGEYLKDCPTQSLACLFASPAAHCSPKSNFAASSLRAATALLSSADHYSLVGELTRLVLHPTPRLAWHVASILNRLPAAPLVGLHVRRGDKLTVRNNHDWIGLLATSQVADLILRDGLLNRTSGAPHHAQAARNSVIAMSDDPDMSTDLAARLGGGVQVHELTYRGAGWSSNRVAWRRAPPPPPPRHAATAAGAMCGLPSARGRPALPRCARGAVDEARPAIVPVPAEVMGSGDFLFASILAVARACVVIASGRSSLGRLIHTVAEWQPAAHCPDGRRRLLDMDGVLTRERQEEGQYYCRLATTAWKVQLCRTHANNGSV